MDVVIDTTKLPSWAAISGIPVYIHFSTVTVTVPVRKHPSRPAEPKVGLDYPASHRPDLTIHTTTQP